MDRKRVSHGNVSFMSPVCHLLQENSHLFLVNLQTLTGILSPRVNMQICKPMNSVLISGAQCRKEVQQWVLVSSTGTPKLLNLLWWKLICFSFQNSWFESVALTTKKKRERNCLMKDDCVFIHHGHQPTKKKWVIFFLWNTVKYFWEGKK